MLIFGIILFLILSAFFSGSEIAFISANKLDLEVKKEKAIRRGKILTKFYDDPKSFLSTMLVGNNIALVVFTSLMTALLLPFTSEIFSHNIGRLLLETLIITVVVLIFGEFLPKTFFRVYAKEVMYLIAFPLAFFKYLLAIPTTITNWMSSGMLKYIFRMPDVENEIAFTRVDLQNYIEDNVGEHADDIDKDIFTNALHLDQMKVRECLVPRTEIVYVDVSAPIEELLQRFQESKLSRIIVVDDEIENVIGYVHHQQLLYQPKSIKQILLEIPFIPEAMNVRDLMIQFIKENTNIACVVNEFGGVAGVITLEDMLEEIFGEIEDEYDEEDFVEQRLAENEYLFSGRLELDYLNEKYENLNIPEGDYHTLSGYIVMTSGEIPDQNTQIRIGDHRFILVDMSDTKIETVRVILDPETNLETEPI